jgi:hypothetical protein
MAIEMSDRCVVCSSERLEPAVLASTAIQLERSSRWRKAVAGGSVKCDVCLECGAIQRLRGEPDELAKLLPDDA